MTHAKSKHLSHAQAVLAILLAGAARAVAASAHTSKPTALSALPPHAKVPDTSSDPSLTAAPGLLQPGAATAQPIGSLVVDAAIGSGQEQLQQPPGGATSSHVHDPALQPVIQNLPAADADAGHAPGKRLLSFDETSDEREAHDAEQPPCHEHRNGDDKMQPVFGLVDPNKRLLAQMGGSSAVDASQQMMQEVAARSDVQGLLQASNLHPDMPLLSLD